MNRVKGREEVRRGGEFAAYTISPSSSRELYSTMRGILLYTKSAELRRPAEINSFFLSSIPMDKRGKNILLPADRVDPS